VLIRRTACKINTALLDRGDAAQPLWPQTRSAILWCSWKRFQEMVGLKRFTSGKSGSDVLVFRPRLRDPQSTGPELEGSCVPGIVSESWGSCILVKTGRADKIQEEWDRFHTFLVDRMHPFMARSESFLAVLPEGRPVEEADSEPPRATIIGSFLGGDLLQAESLEMLAKRSSEFQRCGRAVEQLFTLMAPWYEGSGPRPLKNWSKVFRYNSEGGLILFKKIDVSRKADLKSFAGPLAWDVAFVKEEHLSRHLLGKNRDGLLYRLAETPVRFSLTHGDLHPSNVLADSDNVWLLDFGETGVAPMLFDFAKLEVYLRLWCLDMTPGVSNFETAAMELESQLLDHMMRTEGSLGGVCGLARSLGASPDALLNIARCIALVRRQAAQYCLGSPDRRDYLAVLFLTVMDTLRFADSAPDLIENYRLLVSLFWLLEDTLSTIHGMEPYRRGRVPLEPSRLVSRN
jgi:thiamine kinase-like enzyme